MTDEERKLKQQKAMADPEIQARRPPSAHSRSAADDTMLPPQGPFVKRQALRRPAEGGVSGERRTSSRTPSCGKFWMTSHRCTLPPLLPAAPARRRH